MRLPRAGLLRRARRALITTGALLLLSAPSGARVDDPRLSQLAGSGGVTVVAFTLPETEHVLAAVHDLAGRCVRTLADARFAPGPQRLTWDGRDADGRVVAAGVYFVRLEIAGFVQSRRIVRLP